MGVHIVFPSSKNTQRLASFALISSLASPSRASQLQHLSSKYRKLLASKHTVPSAKQENVFYYLARRNLLRKYKSAKRNELNIEVQDWLLSDPSLPSGTGAEKEDTRSAVLLAAQLGLLWPNSYQRTWLGDLLVHFSSDTVLAVQKGNRNENPFLLNDNQRMLFGWTFFSRDLTFMSYLVRELLRLQEPIRMPNLIDQIRSTLPEFSDWVLKNASSKDERALAKQIRDVTERLLRAPVGRKARAGGVTVQTLRRGFEELLLWRLEALVDLGYLRKEKPLDYEYKLCGELHQLNGLICDKSQDIVRERFFQHWREVCLGIQPSGLVPDEVLSLLFKVNKLRSNKMGYTLIEEAVILANALLTEESSSEVLEFDAAVRAIASASSSEHKVLTSVDKNRRLSAFKMLGAK